MSSADGALVLGTLSGNREAYAKLYDRRAGLVRAICYDFCGDLHTASDLTQEVFMRAYRKLDTLENADRFAAWIAGIARNVCKDWRRGKLRDRHEFTPPEALDSVAQAPASGTDVDELRQAIQTLPEKQRIALHMFYLCEQDVTDTAAALGLSRSGLYHVLASAREHLRHQLAVRETPS